MNRTAKVLSSDGKPERVEHLDANGTLLSEDERMHKIARIFVQHPKLVEVLKVFEEFDFATRPQTSGSCLAVLGPSRTGKSYLSHVIRKKFLKRAAEAYPEANLRSDRLETKDGDIRPVLWVEMPPSGTLISLIEVMLHALGDPFPSKGTKGTKTHRLKKLMFAQQVKVVIFDEAQHIVDSRTRNFSYHAADFIKSDILNGSIDYSSNDIDAPQIFRHVLLFGIDAAGLIFQLNNQINNRRFNHHYFGPYNIKNATEREQFTGFLATMDYKLPFPEWSELSDPEVSEKIHIATEGVVGKVANLIRHAGSLAIRDGSPRITSTHLSEGFEAVGLGRAEDDSPKANPWRTKAPSPEELIPSPASNQNSRSSRVKGTGPSTKPTFGKK